MLPWCCGIRRFECRLESNLACTHPQVPFIFKDIVDTLSITVSTPEAAMATLPLAMLVGCE